MQLTLQHRPDEVVPPGDQGVRHFGVVLETKDAYIDLVERLASHDVVWLSSRALPWHPSSGKRGGKVSDPSGNVIEIKYYDDRSGLFQE